MKVYTFVVGYEDDQEPPPITAKTEVAGGRLLAVQFDDALKCLEEVEEKLERLQDQETWMKEMQQMRALNQYDHNS